MGDHRGDWRNDNMSKKNPSEDLTQVDDSSTLQFYESISANFRHFDEMYVKTSSMFGGFFAIYIGFVSAAFKNRGTLGISVTAVATALVSIMSVTMCLIMLRNREWLKLYYEQMEKIERRMGVTHRVRLVPTSIVLMIANLVLAVASIIATLYFV